VGHISIWTQIVDRQEDCITRPANGLRMPEVTTMRRHFMWLTACLFLGAVFPVPITATPPSAGVPVDAVLEPPAAVAPELNLQSSPHGASVVDGGRPLSLPPTGRADHSAIYDPIRDRMLIFGAAAIESACTSRPTQVYSFMAGHLRKKLERFDHSCGSGSGAFV